MSLESDIWRKKSETLGLRSGLHCLALYDAVLHKVCDGTGGKHREDIASTLSISLIYSIILREYYRRCKYKYLLYVLLVGCIASFFFAKPVEENE